MSKSEFGIRNAELRLTYCKRIAATRRDNEDTTSFLNQLVSLCTLYNLLKNKNLYPSEPFGTDGYFYMPFI